jgi:hypothetical protein
MFPTRSSAFALHLCADVASTADSTDRRWPRLLAAPDTVRRTARICRRAGIAEQLTLRGEQATIAAVTGALQRIGETLTDSGLLVLTFSGHTERGEGPIETTRWRLFDGGLELSQIADQLALLPEAAKLVIIGDTCYAAAIAQVLCGAQRALVLASCSDEQTMIDRRRSEFVVRLEDFVCGAADQGSVDDLRVLLESDTPDCERPCVWTNTASWWSAKPIEIDADRVETLQHRTSGS